MYVYICRRVDVFGEKMFFFFHKLRVRLFAATRPAMASRPESLDTWRTRAPKPRDKWLKDTTCTPDRTASCTKWNTTPTPKTVSSLRERICPHRRRSPKRWSVPTSWPTRTPPLTPDNTTRGVSRSKTPNGTRRTNEW